jgi:phage shock protein E
MGSHLFLVVVVAMVVFVTVRRFAGRGSREAVASALQASALVVDVRTPREYEGGHVDGAVNIPLNELSDRMVELGEKQRSIVLYCHSGMRAATALGMLKRAGYTNVVNAGTIHGVESARTTL